MQRATGSSQAVHIGAAVDVGSNSVHVLVAHVGRSQLRPLLDESVLLGLGPIVDREGRLPADACAATVEALRVYVARAEELRAEHVTLVATEPIRRASNRSVLQADVLAATGHPLHLLSHESEAELTLLGVTHGRQPKEPILVLDIGGGSTELILVTPGGDPVVGPLPTGSSRLTSALVAHDPPTWFEINALRAEAKRLVDGAPAGSPRRGVVVGGTGTNLIRVVPDAQARMALTRADFDRAFGLITSRPAADLVAEFGVNLRRAGQLAAGAALAEAVAIRYDLPALDVADTSLREGAILAVARAGDAWLERLPELVAGR